MKDLIRLFRTLYVISKNSEKHEIVIDEETLKYILDILEATDSDTISRQAVLDAVDTITKWSLLDRNGCHVGVGMKYRGVKETVKSLPQSPSRPQWIPCSERLPYKDELVLCCSFGGVHFIGCIKEAKQGEYMAVSGDSDYKTVYEIVAWMPLPEPYQAQEKSQEVSNNSPELDNNFGELINNKRTKTS